MRKKAQEAINMLTTGRFYTECPCCGDTILLQKADLFYLDDFNAGAEETYRQYQIELEARKKELKRRKESISTKSEVGAKSVNIGLILERIAPSLKEFPFHCNDCRSLFDPIDYLVFEGLASKGIVKKLFWIEIKTGKARLNQREREIKCLVEGKKLAWDIYRMEEHDEE